MHKHAAPDSKGVKTLPALLEAQSQNLGRGGLFAPEPDLDHDDKAGGLQAFPLADAEDLPYGGWGLAGRFSSGNACSGCSKLMHKSTTRAEVCAQKIRPSRKTWANASSSRLKLKLSTSGCRVRGTYGPATAVHSPSETTLPHHGAPWLQSCTSLKLSATPLKDRADTTKLIAMPLTALKLFEKNATRAGEAVKTLGKDLAKATPSVARESTDIAPHSCSKRRHFADEAAEPAGASVLDAPAQKLSDSVARAQRWTPRQRCHIPHAARPTYYDAAARLPVDNNAPRLCWQILESPPGDKARLGRRREPMGTKAERKPLATGKPLGAAAVKSVVGLHPSDGGLARGACKRAAKELTQAGDGSQKSKVDSTTAPNHLKASGCAKDEGPRDFKCPGFQASDKCPEPFKLMSQADPPRRVLPRTGDSRKWPDTATKCCARAVVSADLIATVVELMALASLLVMPFLGLNFSGARGLGFLRFHGIGYEGPGSVPWLGIDRGAGVGGAVGTVRTRMGGWARGEGARVVAWSGGRGPEVV
eukprot:g7529.t1